MNQSQVTTDGPAVVDPLIGDLTTIAVERNKAPVDVQGLVVAPGLAITPAMRKEGAHGGLRYLLTHIPTGLAVVTDRCGAHVQAIAQLAIDSGADYTLADKDAVVAAIQATDFLASVRDVGFCRYRWCDGDGPQPPAWGVRCNTCDWQYDPEEDGDYGPLSLDEARQMADGHECEPRLELSAPDTTDWHPTWMFDKNGQLFPTTGTCKHCGEPIQNIGREFGSLWQHTAARFVMCADARTHAEPAELEGTGTRGSL